MNQGDIVIIRFPFTDLSSQKIRPALVLSNAKYNRNKNILLAGIYGSKRPCSLMLDNTGLKSGRIKKNSFISLQNIITLEKKLILHPIGTLTKEKMQEVRTTLKNYISYEPKRNPPASECRRR